MATVTRLLHDLSTVPTVPELHVREVVTAGLLRRCLVTAHSIAALAAQGQIEGCMVIGRTMLEVWLSLKLVTDDPTDRMARRLTGADYLGRNRAGERMLRDTPTRMHLGQFAGEKDRTIALASGWKRQFSEGSFFDPVRDELERDFREGKEWHGHKTISSAFSAAGASVEYFRLYNLYSPFVHGTNIEYDFTEYRDGKPWIRDNFSSSVEDRVPHLGMASYRLCDSAFTVVQDRLYTDPIIGDQPGMARKQVLQKAKAELLEIQQELIECFGPDPIADSQPDQLD